MPSKVLWVVNYDNINDFLEAAQDCGATDVAIRSDNDINLAIDKFGRIGINVYSWRWPSANADPAMKEANKIVGLLRNGLKGYYVDPEGDPGKSWDWDQNGLSSLARDFCATIKSVPTAILGVTSHYRADKVFARLPWKTFFNAADVLLPQSYWRVDGGIVGHGIPDDNYNRGIAFWQAAGGKAGTIHPMAGEIDRVTADEINTYATAANTAGVNELHFYAWTPNVPQSVMNAIKAL